MLFSKSEAGSPCQKKKTGNQMKTDWLIDWSIDDWLADICRLVDWLIDVLSR